MTRKEDYANEFESLDDAAKELERLKKGLHQEFLRSQSEHVGRKIKKKIKNLEKILGSTEEWRNDYLTSSDMLRWFLSWREYEIMRKKTHKKYPSREEIELFKKEVGFYGKCPDCSAVLIVKHSCELCGWRFKEEPREEEKEELKRSRTIPKHVQREVWRRDMGRCAECGSKERLEFDHIIPFSKGGSNTARNIQLLCEDCNRKKSNQI